MSVNAYLIKKINVKIKNEEVIIEKILEKTPTFNLNNDMKILELFQEYNCDNTNDDLNGELFIDKNTWITILKRLSCENFSVHELKIIKKITKELNNSEIIYFECF